MGHQRRYTDGERARENPTSYVIEETQTETATRHHYALVPAAAAAESLLSCPTLCDPIDGSPPGSSVPGILQEGHWSGSPFPSPHTC